MIEVKFLKDLPIKLTNSNKRVLNVVGGDIYYDNNGNRYAYITFNNVSRSPIFSLQLYIREYSIEGKFIRDNEFFQPYIYYPTGNFVTEEPIPLDEETEAVEVTIVKVTLNDHVLLNDKVKAFRAEHYADLYQRKAPVKKPGTATSFSFNESVAPAAREEASQSDVEYEDGASNESAPTPAINISRENMPSELVQYGKEQKTWWRFVYPGAGLVALIIILIFIMASVTAGVNAFNALF